MQTVQPGGQPDSSRSGMHSTDSCIVVTIPAITILAPYLEFRKSPLLRKSRELEREGVQAPMEKVLGSPHDSDDMSLRPIRAMG
jgi:hypothetical protein